MTKTLPFFLPVLPTTTADPPTIKMLTHNNTFNKNPGENVQLICDFYAVKFDVFTNPAEWTKNQLGEQTSVNIASSLNEPFNSSRFEVTLETKRMPIYSFMLAITSDPSL